MSFGDMVLLAVVVVADESVSWRVRLANVDELWDAGVKAKESVR